VTLLAFHDETFRLAVSFTRECNDIVALHDSASFTHFWRSNMLGLIARRGHDVLLTSIGLLTIALAWALW